MTGKIEKVIDKANEHQEAILVLEVEAKASIPIMESCAAMGLHVIAGSSKRHCAGMYSRVKHQRLLYPNPNEKPDKCINFLLDFLKNHSVSVLFPVGDVMTDLIARHQDKLRENTNLILPPYETFIKGRNKVHTLKAAQRAGCPIPKTWYPDDEPLDNIAEQIQNFPVLIKPAISAGSRGITFCNSKKGLLDEFEKVQQDYGQSFIQEYLPQNGTQYKVDIVMDLSQNLLCGVVYSKLRYYPPDGGSSVLNKTEHRPDILESAVKVLKELKWVGFCDFDFVTDSRDNLVKLVEINPRFPESFRATIAAGVDMTKIIYQLAKGQNPAAQLEYKDERYVRFLFGDIMWFLTTKENRWKAKPSFFSFFRDDTIYQLLRAKDLGIIFGYILENLFLLTTKQGWQQRLRLKRKIVN